MLYDKTPHVVLIHGLGRRASSMRRVAATLQREGYCVTNWSYPSRTQTLDTLADRLAALFTTLAQPATPIHVVTHSMGAIVLRRALARTTLPQLGNIVMLAPPNNGSSVARCVLANPFVRVVLGAAAQTLVDGVSLNAICATPTTPVMVIAGTNAHDLRNPVALLSASILEKPHDGTVAVRETLLPRMDAFVEVAACHTWIMNHPQTLSAISAFLRA